MAVQLKRRRFTVDEYYRMAEAGIFTEDDRVELVEGEILEMAPIGSPHAGHVNRLTAVFTARLGARVIVSVQNPVRLSEYSEPQPDVTLLHPRSDFYGRAHPGAADVFLIVEVMDTSVEFDRRVKVPLYARAGVPETWLLDVNADRLEVYRAPAAQGYGDARILRRSESVTIQAFPDLVLTVDGLLG